MSEHEQSPEEIRREIEQTRTNLGETLHDIEDKVSPARITQRRTEAVRGRWRSIRESVMGARDDTAYRVSGQSQQVGERASQAAQGARETVQQAPQQAISQTRGNPLAAGLIAFGGGLLLASVLPASEQEQQAASTLKDRYAEPLKQELQQAGQEAKEGLQGSIQQATREVRSTAQDAAEQTRGEARGSAETVRDDAQRAREEASQRT